MHNVVYSILVKASWLYYPLWRDVSCTKPVIIKADTKPTILSASLVTSIFKFYHYEHRRKYLLRKCFRDREVWKERKGNSMCYLYSADTISDERDRLPPS